MNFIQRQIKQIRSGGTQVLQQKIRDLPQWLLRWFVTGKYVNRLTYYGFRVAVSIKPGWAAGHAMLAATLISLGRFDEAMSAWKQSFLHKPDWTVAHNIHWDLFRRGQPDQARNVIQEFLDAQNDFAREHQLDKLGIRFICDLLDSIGHIALLDYYTKMGILGHRSSARPVLLVNPVLSNPCYMDYWRDYLPDIITDPLAIKLLSPVAKYLEDHPPLAVMNSSSKQICGLYTMEQEVQAQWEAEGRGPLLTLDDADDKHGRQCLQDLGVPTDAWFVGLHVRYDVNSIADPRNADISTYRLAMESITARGGWVIRMGNPAMPPLPPMPRLIDYAHSAVRSDWMDVFLWAKCRFFIGTNSGPLMVPPTFGVPCVETNWSPLGLRLWFNKDLCIFKLYWSKSEARYLNFAEVISSKWAWSASIDYLASQGIRLEDNTSEEINAVVIEMLDRMDGKLQYDQEDEGLQERFDKLYTNNKCKANARIGRDFLRKWAHLL